MERRLFFSDVESLWLKLFRLLTGHKERQHGSNQELVCVFPEAICPLLSYRNERRLHEIGA